MDERTPDAGERRREAADAQALVARALLGAFADAGVRHVVLSPGSRSTPFVIAASREPRLRLHDLVDERVASFVALGVARAGGAPALMITTSGSAPAHALPAVLEAERSRLPLIVLSADRPAWLHAAGANQTVEQRDLFGAHVALSLTLPEVPAPLPEAELRRLARVAARQAAQLVNASAGGPVHLDAPAHKPLEPGVRASTAAGVTGPRFFAAQSRPSTAGLEALSELLAEARRGLVVAGAMGPSAEGMAPALAALCRRHGLTLFAESTSQLRFAPALRDVSRLDRADALYRGQGARAGLRPDLVLTLGAFPTSKGVARLLAEGGARGDLRHAAIARGECPDAEASLELWLDAPPEACLDALVELAPAEPRADESFHAALREADAALGVEAERLLSEYGDALTPQGVIRVAAGAASSRWLGIGNGLTVRRADDWLDRALDVAGVLHQRGLSGIDGLVSGAIGAALGSGRPQVFVLGDVAFRHDLAGLAAATELESPLALVVVDDGGGRIFEGLPIGARADLAGALSHFTTPGPSRALAAAKLFDLPGAAPSGLSELSRELVRALSRPTLSVIVAHVDAGDGRALDGALRAAAEEVAP